MVIIIYLDNAATTKPLPEVVSAITKCLTEDWGNPSSLYGHGVKAKSIVTDARNVVADFIGAKPSEIIFTSGACEANSLAIDGFLKKNDYWFITSEIEHKSIMNDFDTITTEKIKVPVDGFGFVNMGKLEDLLQMADKKCLVSIQWANNEIGTIQHMKEISELVHKYGGVLHTDATQMIPDTPINVNDYGIDMLSFSGQKLHATKGIGVLYVRKGIEISPIIHGSQEKSLRGGTENVPYIAGLKAAIENIKYDNGEIRDYFVKRCMQEIKDCALVGADNEDRLKNNASLIFYGVESESVLLMLDQKGICVSSGSACNSASLKPSYVLEAIEVPKEDINRVVRFTFDNGTTKYDVEIVVSELKRVIKLLRKMSR